ncbi:MAG: alpha/beta fold hydrolase [Myxococcota bacterium]
MAADAEASPETIVARLPDGGDLSMRVFDAAGSEHVVLMLCGLGVAARYYAPTAAALAERGHTVVTADWRGLGASTIRAQRGVDFGYRELLEDDLPPMIAAVRQRCPDRPLTLLGHSLGGQLGALHLSRHPGDAAGLVMVGACSLYWKNWGTVRGPGFYALSRVYRATAKTLGYFPGKRMGFGGTEARTLMLDWSHTVKTGRYRLAGSSVDYEASLRSATTSILALRIAGDTWAPERAVRHLLEKMPNATVEHREVGPDPDHTLDHFRWAKHPRVVVEAVERWLSSDRTRA